MARLFELNQTLWIIEKDKKLYNAKYIKKYSKITILTYIVHTILYNNNTRLQSIIQK